MERDRYDRQRRIRGWRQKHLRQARILVAGAGALGNEVIKNLVLVGIGHLMVVDCDHIAQSNLSRTVLFRERDVGRSKAQVAAEAAAALNPEVDVRALHGDLLYDVGLGFYRHVDLVIGGLDNLAARLEVGMRCALAGVPFLDGGMWAFGGEARWFVPGDGPCFACTMDDTDWARAFERFSCTGFRSAAVDVDTPPIPTTLSTAAVIGGLLAQEAVRYLCGWEISQGVAVVYNGQTRSMHHAALSRAPHCPYHTPYQDVVELPHKTRDLVAGTLLQQAEADLRQPAILELGRDFLVSLYCPTCKKRDDIDTVVGRIDETSIPCPHCGVSREPEIVSRLDSSITYVKRSLQALGVPPGEILAARAGRQWRLYECTGDVTAWQDKHIHPQERGRSTNDDTLGVHQL